MIPARLLPMLGYDGPRLVFAGVETIGGYDVEAVTANFAISGIPLAVKRVTVTVNASGGDQYDVEEQNISVNGVSVTRLSLTSV